MQVEYKEENWKFLNMNSPTDLYAAYDQEMVALYEYDRCRDGHALLSKFYVDKEHVFFQTHVKDIGTGVGIGLYMGDGCYSDYCLIVADKEGISIRIPNGVSRGDTFRMEGPKRYFTIGKKQMSLEKTFLLGYRKEHREITIYINGKEELGGINVNLPFENEKNYAKLLVKAMNEYPGSPKAKSVFGKYEVNKQIETCKFEGICKDIISGRVLSDVYIHVLGDFDKWSKSDINGSFSITDMPLGRLILVCGLEGKTFELVETLHNKQIKDIHLSFHKKEERINIPQENLETDLSFQGINGIWKFDFDRGNIGEKEKWYKKGNHIFAKCIRVPFSWQSLMAFGEEALADSNTLHQANTFTCNEKETGEIGWYQRTICVSWAHETELVFAGVSGVSKVWLDEREVGCILDSYNKYIFRLGRLASDTEYTITVMVNYQHGNNWACSGKQGFWFTDSPGIWQNVWLRERKPTNMTDLFIYPQLIKKNRWRLDFQILLTQIGKASEASTECVDNRVYFEVLTSGSYKVDIYYHTLEEKATEVTINGVGTGTEVVFDAVPRNGYYDKKEVYLYLFSGENRLEFTGKQGSPVIQAVSLKVIDFSFNMDLYFEGNLIAVLKPKINLKTGILEARFSYEIGAVRGWSQTQPYQHKIMVILRERGETTSYKRRLGIRSLGVSDRDDVEGIYITLNGKKTYIRGVLDQGYNPWGIYTYKNIIGNTPGTIAFDIEAAKHCGYNLIRMHLKDNEPNWYQTCDETGMLVWDEIPTNFYGVAADGHWQGMFKRQLKRMIKKHNYHASVIICSIFNESWGITGNHEKSPWEDEKGQSLIKEYAKFYKAQSDHVLIIDNSGFGKTSETDLIDFHSYPQGFFEAKDFFTKIAEQNHEGSCFNFYNSRNKQLLKKKEIRELLQKNCSQNLKDLVFIGNEVQGNQPVLISEFIHTDKQEELVRIFPRIAGYVRMNIASQENEDTSPLTATRCWRNFGFVNEDFSNATYQMANSENLIFLDIPFLSQVHEKEMVSIPIYLSIWGEAFREIKEITVDWHLVGIDYRGRYLQTDIKGTITNIVKKEKPFLFSKIEFQVPSGWKASYLFAKAHDKQRGMSITYVQLEIFPEKVDANYVFSEHVVEILPEHMVLQNGFLDDGQYQDKGRHLIWGYGSGEIKYQLPVNQNDWTKARLVLEASACSCIQGTRETDENLSAGIIEVYVQDIHLATVKLEGQPSDKRGLFSNSSTCLEKEFKYSRTGVYGYGYRVEIQFTQEIINSIKSQLFMNITLKAQESGIVIYGNRMGKYGCNPAIEFE